MVQAAVVTDSSSPVGVWGKHPGRPDFVRWNAGEVSRLGMDRWLEGAFEVLASERRQLGAEPLSFLFPGQGEALVGALGPSRDAVGRTFPLMAVARVAMPTLGESYPLFPLACAQILDGTADLVATAATVSLEELEARAEVLPPQAWTPLSQEDLHAYLGGTEMAELQEAMGGADDDVPYGLATLAQACAQMRDKNGKSGAPPVTVDAPAPSHALVAMWLELARKGLPAGKVPTVLWSRGAGRLLMSLGAPSGQLLAYAAAADHPSQNLWPLRTKVTAAKADARKALAPGLLAVVSQPHATIAELLRAG